MCWSRTPPPLTPPPRLSAARIHHQDRATADLFTAPAGYTGTRTAVLFRTHVLDATVFVLLRQLLAQLVRVRVARAEVWDTGCA